MWVWSHKTTYGFWPWALYDPSMALAFGFISSFYGYDGLGIHEFFHLDGPFWLGQFITL
jgi:hypothetical protein